MSQLWISLLTASVLVPSALCSRDSAPAPAVPTQLHLRGTLLLYSRTGSQRKRTSSQGECGASS